MSLNWKELELLLSEMPLRESYIQKITEHSVSSFTFSMFSRTEKAWLLFFEMAAPHASVCRTGIMRKKDPRMQRFTQYMNAHVVGRKVTAVHQYPYDRAFVLELRSSENTINMHVRLYSGPGANIIITDNSGVILELLYRRPGRHEEKGAVLTAEERTDEGPRHFTARDYDRERFSSFNDYIDRSEDAEASGERRQELEEKIKEKRDKEIALLRDKLSRNERRLQEASGYEETKRVADILSGSIWNVRKGMTEITLDDCWSLNLNKRCAVLPSASSNMTGIGLHYVFLTPTWQHRQRSGVNRRHCSKAPPGIKGCRRAEFMNVSVCSVAHRDRWVRVLEGTMHEQEWQGAESEAESSTGSSGEDSKSNCSESSDIDDEDDEISDSDEGTSRTIMAVWLD